ncbi:MAG: hypothetical protein N3G21_08475 [Candidatus Hydrogenedentes bacterium]|nr:hypothetical protein [Candidatus Hydrogenedentota bacterium]
MLRRSLKMAFWIWYDYMGGWFLINFILLIPLFSFFTIFLVMMDKLPELTYPIFFSVPFLYLFISHTFVANCVSLIIDRKESLLKSLLPSFKKTFSKKASVGLEFFVLLSLIGYSGFLSTRFSVLISPYLTMFIGVIILWCLMLVLICFMWIIPSLAWKELPVFKYLRWGFVLTLSNPGFTFIVCVCYTIFLALNFIPIYSLSWGLVYPAIFLASAYEIMYRKYEALRSGGNLSDWQIYRDREDEFLNRGFIHILRPWEMK